MAQEKKKGISTGIKVGLGCCGGLIALIIIIAVAAGSGSKSSNSNTKGSNTATPTTKPTTKKFDIDDIYSQINTGMSEADVEEIITQKPISCSESEWQGIGTSKACSYGNVFLDSGSIMVTYMNGKVYSKTKSQY